MAPAGPYTPPRTRRRALPEDGLQENESKRRLLKPQMQPDFMTQGGSSCASNSKDHGNSSVHLMERAMAALRPEGCHGRLPCREEEQAYITAHLRTAAQQGGSMQVLYVSGMPGTGKTATVLEAMKLMHADSRVPQFEVAHINAMRLGAPVSAFRDILCQVRPHERNRCSACAAHSECVRFFTGRAARDPVVVLLIDEIDHLVTHNQAVLYKVFDMLMLPSHKLVMVAISNTMDLPERLLPRVASRFGIVRVNFQPYSRDQIAQILSERLQGHGASGSLSTTAVRLCAAKVAAGTGDIRKALQLCRRAVEVRSSRTGEVGPVDFVHLNVAEKELLHANPAARAVGGLGPRARRFLAATLLELRRADADVVPLRVVTLRYGKLMTALNADAEQSSRSAPHQNQPPFQPLDETLFLAERLESMALLVQQRLPGPSTRAASGVNAGPALTLGSGIDMDDLSVALVATEEDEGLKELIQGVEQA